MVKKASTPEGATTSPPAAPWQKLTDNGLGYLSVYFSDPLARWPVRHITRISDNKSDPNLETQTYGLFSTCEPNMRNRIVQDGASTVFFISTPEPGSGRVLSGYYHIGWYTEGTQGAINNDYALAASSMRFIDPIPLIKLPKKIAFFCTTPSFRQMRPVDAKMTMELKAIIDSCTDRTSEYINEIHRLEKFALDQSGYTYPSWGRTQGFEWSDASEYFRQEGDIGKIPNSSPTNKWRCSNCKSVILNSALLKKCPVCEQNAVLTPEPDADA